MNYLRIYNELIEHRKMMPRLEGVYYERHHIKPRCMGGGDEEENLVYLTAEDHFMAHLLLAKAYGGTLWAAANFMKRGVNGGTIKHRRSFAIIRMQLSLSMRDCTVSEYINGNSGDVFSATQYELITEYGLTNSEASRVANGERSARGIALTSYISGKIKPTVYDFECIKTGEVHSMTVKECCIAFHTRVSNLRALISGRITQTAGLKLAGTETYNRGKSYEFVHIASGKTLIANAKMMREIAGMRCSQFSWLINGKIKTSCGYCLPENYKTIHHTPHK